MLCFAFGMLGEACCCLSLVCGKLSNQSEIEAWRRARSKLLARCVAFGVIDEEYFYLSLDRDKLSNQSEIEASKRTRLVTRLLIVTRLLQIIVAISLSHR